jgi:probable F420-dependent oxidoreductase
MSVGIGRTGVWLRSRGHSEADLASAAREVEQMGYGAVWLGGADGNLRAANAMLRATERIVVATGIVSIWTIPATELAANHARLSAEHPNRFLLGLGASHESSVGERYRQPFSAMVDYLDALDQARPRVPARQRILAALGPRMLALSAQRSLGAHPYLVTPEYTAQARATLGAGPLMATEQKVVLEPDPERARALAHQAVANPYLQAPNYLNNLRRSGFDDSDFAGTGSERLIDALVAFGEEGTSERIRAHLDAGADHVCVQVVTGEQGLPIEQWAAVADIIDTGL